MFSIVPSVVAQTGEYSFKEYNQTEIDRIVLKLTNENQNRDAQTVKETVAHINNSLSAFINSQLSNSDSVTMMAAKSQPDPIEYLKFMALASQYEADAKVLENAIQTITTLADAMKAQPNTTVQSVGKIDLETVKNHYLSELKQLTTKARDLKFNVQMPDQAIKSLKLEDANVAVNMPAEKINEIRAEIARLRADNPIFNQQIEQYNRFLRRTITRVIKTLGEDQNFRLDMNNMRGERLSELEEFFWARSALRLLYGYRLGGIVIEGYQYRALNMDWILNTNQIKFNADSIRDTNVLSDYQAQLATALTTQNSRAFEIGDVASFKSSIGLFNRFSSLITFLSGRSKLVQMNALVLTYLAADIEEELTLASKGLAAARDLYTKRFFANAESKEHYSKKVNEYFPELVSSSEEDESQVNQNDGFSDGGLEAQRVTIDSPRGVFNIAKLALDSVQARFEQARTMEEGLKRIEAKSQTKNGAKRRANTLSGGQ